MTQVWLYDENKLFIESTFVEEVSENMTTEPLLVGYVKPTFNEELEEWYEGATEQEIEDWEEEDKTSNSPIAKSNQELTRELKSSQEYIQDLEIKLIDLEIKMYEYM